MIDLRSDTVTQPTQTMLKAMANAELGDDVYGEDPTVNMLEERAAELMGKDAALLVSSGTQGNLLGVLANCRSGDEIIMGDEAHIFLNESAGVAAIGGIQIRLVPNCENGTLNPQDVERAIRAKGDNHFPPTTLICLENTQNRCNGGLLTTEDTRLVAKVAQRYGIPIHLDGARIFNASVALETPVAELVKDVNDVTFCLSKGLSSPIGSVLCGSSAFIDRARRWRKMVGGSMRQAGIIAAAGLVSLDTMIERLADDHANARRLSHGLSHTRRIRHDPSVVQSNIVFFELESPSITPDEFVQRLGYDGIKCNHSDGRVRMVTHRHITSNDIDKTLAAVSKAMK